jgi:hypothetical protein
MRAVRDRLRAVVPGRLRAAVRRWRANRPTTLEPLELAFRAFIASRMHALLARDAVTTPAHRQSGVTV